MNVTKFLKEKKLEKLQELEHKFNGNLESIDQIIKIGTDVAEILIDLLESSKKEYEKIEGFIPFKNIIDRDIEVVKKIKTHRLLKNKYRIIYNQATVLIIAGFESFMNELFEILINDYLYLLKWPKDNKIIIKSNSLNYYKSLNIGNVIVKSLKGKVNFQDLGSTLRFLKEYLDINTDDFIKDKKDDIILFQALRHTILHNNSKIDDDFIMQIRDTRHIKDYEIGNEIKLSEEEYCKAKNLFNLFVSEILEKIYNKYDIYLHIKYEEQLEKTVKK